MFGKISQVLYALAALLISLSLIAFCQVRPNSGINLKQLPKNRKLTPRPNINSGKESGFLSIKNGNLFYKTRRIFLSGNNVLYINSGQDFGNGNYYNVKSQYESFLKQVSNAGGNSIRVLIHGSGNTTPMLDSQGYATGSDTASLAQEIGLFLDAAKRNSIFVILNLWSADYNMSSDVQNLFRQEPKLNSYIAKVVKPLVSALKKKNALAVYDVIEDPAGSMMSNIVDSNRCYDTQNLVHQFASYTANNFTAKQIQRFVNHVSSAIKTADPKALVTLTTTEQEGSGLCDWCFNYWQDKCLISAGGKSNGVLDVYSFDCFTFPGEPNFWNPMRKKATDYKLGRPLLLTAASANCSVTNSAITNFNHAFNNGYAGILGWRYTFGEDGICNDPPSVCDSAVSALRSKTLVKVTIK